MALKKLSRPGAKIGGADPAVRPAGWGAPATEEPAQEEAPKQNIQTGGERVDPEQELEDKATDEHGTKSMFSSAVKEALNADETEQPEQTGDGDRNDPPRRPVQQEPTDAGADAHQPSDGSDDAPTRNPSSRLSNLKKAELIKLVEELQASAQDLDKQPGDTSPATDAPYRGETASLGAAPSAYSEAQISINVHGTPDQVAEALKRFQLN